MRISHFWTNQRGYILVVTFILTSITLVLTTAFALLVQTDVKLRGGSIRAQAGFYAAEAGLNTRMAELFTIFDSYGVPQGAVFDETSISFNGRTVHTQVGTVAGSCSDTGNVNCFVTIPAGEKFAGLRTLPYHYAITSTAVNAEGDAEAQVGAEVVIHNIPIFQFLVFYAHDLEILPGPNMNLSGRIHANGDLYLNAGATMTIGDRPSPPYPAPGNPFVQVSAAGQIIRGRKENSQCGGTILIDKLEDSDGDGDLDAQELACSGGSSPVPQAVQDTFLGSVEAGINTIQIPPIDDLQREGEGKFWQLADLRIVLRLDLPKQSVDFGAPGLCPGGPGNLVSPALFPIEVQDATGMRDPVKTNALWRFMCERRGAIFYNDIPNTASNGTANDNAARDPDDYTPPFGGNNGTNGGAELVFGDPTYNNYLVYRRVGEDTNGDGFINTLDFDPDICPDDVFDANPWWEPAYCANFDGDGLPNSAGRWFADTDYRRGGYYNHREDEWLYLLNVNMRALIEWNQVNGGVLFPPDDQTNWGVVVFLSVQGPFSTLLSNYAVRVFDSADLDTRNTTFPDFDPDNGDPTGLSVVSDQAIYIQGNYNAYSTQTRGQKQPAAVMGDSLNILSQTWEVPIFDAGQTRANDRKSLSDNWKHRYVQIQDAPCGPAGCGPNLFYGLNAALLGGVDDTVGSSYNGGLENYPRFHEKWSSRTFTYRGSFVSLGPPLHADGSWKYGGPIYEAPVRDWDYNADFNRVENLPPLTPKVTYLQQKMYTRMYD